MITFIFNDGTKTRLRKTQNAEMKYKSLFFSIIAHEFKNPLICITELINRLSKKDTFHNTEDNKIIHQIKGMSNFLLVLVKDLDFFAESELGNETNLETKEVDLDEILNFCAEITESLIKKSNRSNSLQFEVIKSPVLGSPYLLTNGKSSKSYLISFLMLLNSQYSEKLF
jgi:signal transduction histidine kinase